MNINMFGAALGVAALATIVIYHGHREHEAAAIAPPPAAVSPISAAVEKAPSVERPREIVPAVRKPVYHRVLKGGKIDGPVNCKSVPPLAKVYSPEQVLAAAKQYGLTPEQLGQLRVCLNK